MINIYVDRSDNKIKIESPDPKIKYYLESRQSEVKFIPWQKKWGTVTKTIKIYDSKKLNLVLHNTR